MDVKKYIYIFIITFFLKSCYNFEAQKIEINYKKSTIKVLSDDYIIGSIRMKNNQKKYYLLELRDTLKGINEINFKNKPNGYEIVVDSLDYNCSKNIEINSPGLLVTILKKGFRGKENGNENKEIQFFNYNKLPCNSSLIDTIEANSPYK